MISIFFAGSDDQPGAIQRQRWDPVSLGFTQPDIRYEWNKLYVLGLHYRTSPDSLKNFMELISGYDVKRVDWFKPNGKAIVTFNTEKITGKGKNWALISKQRGTTRRKKQAVLLLTCARVVKGKVKCTYVQKCTNGENGEKLPASGDLNWMPKVVKLAILAKIARGLTIMAINIPDPWRLAILAKMAIVAKLAIFAKIARNACNGENGEKLPASGDLNWMPKVAPWRLAILKLTVRLDGDV